MQKIKLLSLFLLLAIFAASCGAVPQNITVNLVESTPDINQIVQATFQALTQQAAPQSLPTATQNSPLATQPAPTTGDATGSIAGILNYPASKIPAMYVTAYEVGTQNYQYVITNDGQGVYKIEGLKPGTYHLVVYTVGGNGAPAGLAAGYTQAVPCGLTSPDCTDHTLVDVKVEAGKVTADINPFDWYPASGTFPSFPQQAVAASETPMSSLPPMGTISGALSYPSSHIPALRIAAFSTTDDSMSYIDTADGQSTYSFDLPVGTYYVVAYLIGGGDFSGGYTQAVLCGLDASCNDHTLVVVTVTEGVTTPNINPGDWYAPSGTFPPAPGS